MKRYVDLVAAGIMVLLMIPFSASSLVLPWGRDQGIYAEAAWQFLGGKMPYSEIFIFKPPGTVFVHALSQLLFGRNMLAIRAFDLGWTLLTGVVIYAIARKATGSAWAAALAGVFFAWRYADYGYWSHGQTDAFANLPYGIALLLILAEPSPNLRWVFGLGAGVAVGAAFWFKYTTGGLLPFVILVPLLHGGWRAWPTAVAVAAGFVGSVAAVLWWLWLGGALSEFLAIQQEIVLPYTGATNTDGGIARRSLYKLPAAVGRYGAPTLVPWGLGTIAVLGHTLVRGRRLWREGVDTATLAKLAALAWALSGLLSGFVQGKFWQYQFMTTLGGGALLAAIGLWALSRIVPGRWALIVALGWLAWAGTGRFPNRWRILGDRIAGQLSWEQVYEEGTYRNSGHDLVHNQRAARWLAKHVPADETVYIWGYDPMIYVLADRQPATRFPYHYPQIVPWAPRRYRTELLETLRAAPPTAIVVGTRDSVRGVTGTRRDSRELMERWPDLSAFVKDNYRQADRQGRFVFWLRDTDSR